MTRRTLAWMLAGLLTTPACLFRDLGGTRGPGDADRIADAPPPDPTGLTATPLSATRVRLSWQSGGETTAGFRLAFRGDGVPPADCDGAVPESEIFGTTHDVRGLEPGSRYDFRVCAINANAPPLASPGVTATATTPAAPTLPPCDVTVATGSHTASSFQSTLDNALAGGDGGDGVVAVCLEDGVLVGMEGGPTIEIPGDDLFIFAHDGDDARFINPSDNIFFAFGRSNLRLHNLTLRPEQYSATAIDVADSEVALLSHLRIAIDSGSGAALNAYNSTFGDITAVEVRVEGGDSDGFFLQAGSSIGSIADTHITTFDRNVAITLDNSSIGIVQASTFTTGGASAHAIVLRANAHIDAMSEVRIRRLGAYGSESNTHAIVCDDALGTGGLEHFVTNAIYDVTICSVFDEAQWTTPFADTTDGAVFAEPTTHVAHAGGGRGCETFPFNDGSGSTAGTDHRIVVSGPCSADSPADEVTVSTDLTFTEFQGVLNDAQAAGDLDGDGLIHVRIAGGVVVRNSNTLAQGRIVIPGSNFTLYAPAGTTATFLSERSNGAGGDDHGVILARGVHNLSLRNLSLRSTGIDGVALATEGAFGGDRISSVLLDHLTVHTAGARATGISLQDTAVQVLAGTTVVAGGDNAVPVVVGCSAAVNVIRDSSFISNGDDAPALLVNCNSSVNLLREVTLETTESESPGLLVYKDSMVAAMVGPMLIRTSGESSHGIVLAGASAVGAMENVTVARSADATTAAVAILIDPEDGPENYFGSADITNVTVCTESGGLPWEAGSELLAEGDDDGPWTPPAAYVPHLPGPNFGAQTFPFEEPALTAQGIQFGGACP